MCPFLALSGLFFDFGHFLEEIIEVPHGWQSAMETKFTRTSTDQGILIKGQ